MDCSLKNALSCPWRLLKSQPTKKTKAINIKLPTFSLLQKGFSTYAKIWKLDLFHSYNSFLKDPLSLQGKDIWILAFLRNTSLDAKGGEPMRTIDRPTLQRWCLWGQLSYSYPTCPTKLPIVTATACHHSQLWQYFKSNSFATPRIYLEKTIIFFAGRKV